jgi:hypothetical protein
MNVTLLKVLVALVPTCLPRPLGAVKVTLENCR